MKSQMPAASQDKMMPSKEQDKTMNASQPMATPSMKQDQALATSSKMSDEGKMASANKVSSPMMADHMKDQKRHASIYWRSPNINGYYWILWTRLGRTARWTRFES